MTNLFTTLTIRRTDGEIFAKRGYGVEKERI